MKIVLSNAADADLDAILEYGIENHGQDVAEAYLRTIDKAMARLSIHAELGIDQSDLKRQLRSYPVGEHRIYYLPSPELILIVRILHKAIDVRRHI